jgi:hypothetical protein
MKDQFQRLLRLAKTTGDRLIVTDKNGENAFVVMDIDQYEALIYGQEPEVFDDWDFEEHPETQSEEQVEELEEGIGPTIWDTMQPAGKEQETWDLDGLSEEEMSDLERQFKEFVVENGSKFDEKAEDTEEVELKDETLVVSEEEPDEEQFYLEPIE